MSGFMITSVHAEATIDGTAYALQQATPSHHIDELAAVGVDIVAHMRENIVASLIHDAAQRGVTIEATAVTTRVTEHRMEYVGE